MSPRSASSVLRYSIRFLRLCGRMRLPALPLVERSRGWQRSRRRWWWRRAGRQWQRSRHAPFEDPAAALGSRAPPGTVFVLRPPGAAPLSPPLGTSKVTSAWATLCPRLGLRPLGASRFLVPPNGPSLAILPTPRPPPMRTTTVPCASRRAPPRTRTCAGPLPTHQLHRRRRRP